ncbi:MAG: hypothetical protein QM744_04135 [Mesorhizobium sp.]
MTLQIRNPGTETGAPKIAFGGAKNVGTIYTKAPSVSTPATLQDCGSFESIGTISRRVIVNSVAARLHVSAEVASVAIELAQLGRRAS